MSTAIYLSDNFNSDSAEDCSQFDPSDRKAARDGRNRTRGGYVAEVRRLAGDESWLRAAAVDPVLEAYFARVMGTDCVGTRIAALVLVTDYALDLCGENAVLEAAVDGLLAQIWAIDPLNAAFDHHFDQFKKALCETLVNEKMIWP